MTGSLVWHLFGSILALSSIAAILWWVSKRSRACAGLIGTGIALRACLGLTLFCISYYQLPIAQDLQSGGGYWKHAPDAQLYYRAAVKAADQGLATVRWYRGSPEFVVLLALWMRLVGQNPVAGLFLNIAAYACMSGLVVARFRPQRRDHLWPCLLTIGCYTFSPALLIHGSQPLKDELFVYVVGLGLLAASVFLPALIEEGKRIGLGAALVALAALCTAMYVIAGIRTYYGLTLWAVLAMVLLAGGFRQRLTRLLPYSGAAIAVLVVLWMLYAFGATTAAYRELINPHTVWTSGVARLPAVVGSRLSGFRSAFELSGGGTNLGDATAPTPAPADTGEPEIAAGGAPVLAPSSPVRRVVFGMAVFLTPISLMRAMGLVDFSGGRGLLLIADLDTLFVDATLVAMLMLLARRFALVRRNWIFALTAALVGGVTAVLLGYVVTNYGTLFRVRLTAVMPFWLLPFAAIDHAFGEGAMFRSRK
jgi:hypothetical protein